VPSDLARRRALLTAALGFLQVDQSKVSHTGLTALHTWLDNWRGLGAIMEGMLRAILPPTSPQAIINRHAVLPHHVGRNVLLDVGLRDADAARRSAVRQRVARGRRRMPDTALWGSGTPSDRATPPSRCRADGACSSRTALDPNFRTALGCPSPIIAGVEWFRCASVVWRRLTFRPPPPP